MVADAETPQILAVVPARGGSKSIPRKNLRRFAGHPLLAFSIAAGLQSRSVSRVLVSTEDPEIAEVAKAYGAEVPFLRPLELAQDDTPDLPVFHHVLKELADREGYLPQVVVQLRPTSPIRPRDCVDQAVELLVSHPDADSVRGVVPSAQNPYKMWRIQPSGSLQPLLDDVPEGYNRPRQLLPPTFWQTGHVDAIWARTILGGASMSGRVIWPLILDPAYTVDIDTLSDWERAERLAYGRTLEMVWPGAAPRPLPPTVRMLVLDFDGVLTDNRVWVDGEGREAVLADRGDGMGIARLKEAGVEVVVLSTESDPVVAARCAKLGIPARQNLSDKGSTLETLLKEKRLDAAEVVYLGNDVNDLGCFPLVGCAVAVADAVPEVLRQADLILHRPGGRGAVRELCELLIERGRSST